eukprot:gene10989-7633_t
MMRRTFMRLTATAAAAGAESSKLKTLHKLLTGEVHFKNDAPLKYCNIVHNFGDQWQSELEGYAAALPAEERTVLERQVQRVLLTRYTTRELAMYCGDGPDRLDETARKENINQARAFLELHGEEKLRAHVAQEAVNANWTPAQVDEFMAAVKQ